MIRRKEFNICMDKVSAVCLCHVDIGLRVTPTILRYRVQVTDSGRQQRILTSLLQAQYFHHAYNLVKWGKWSLTPDHIGKLLKFLTHDKVPKASLYHLVEVAPLTEADTALILAVSPFNTRKSTAPVVTNITHLKRVATRTGQSVTDIYFDDARCEFITPNVATQLVKQFPECETTGEQYKTLLSLKKKWTSLQYARNFWREILPPKPVHKQYNCVSLPFIHWCSLVDRHEKNKFELSRTAYPILHRVIILHSSLPEAQNGMSYLLRRVHAKEDSGVWQRSCCVSCLVLPRHQALCDV